MTKARSVSLRLFTMIGTAAYWIWFWTLFVVRSTPVPSVPEWGASVSSFQVFSRGIGADGEGILHSILMQSNFWLNIPCWVITWPLMHVGISGSFLGTNMAGGRLLLITLLSPLQWCLIAALLERFRGQTKK
jgi:hypothetical protein